MKDVNEVYNAAKAVIDCQRELEFVNNVLYCIEPELDKTITISSIEVDVKAQSPSKFITGITIDELRDILNKRSEKKAQELLKIKETYESLWK